jgi:cytidylate kinase
LNSYQNKFPVIAIDGTACSGKGTLAKKLSNVLGFDHLDSGVLYRIYAYEFLKTKKKIENIENISLNLSSPSQINLYNQKDLRTEIVSKIASKIAKSEFVRKQLIDIQRNFADNPPNKKGSVIDGRDITSVIIPNAEVKFYIDADLDKRAKRRQIQLNLKEKDYNKIYIEMKLRDKNDKNRQSSPLIKTKDSLFIDTTNISEKEVLEIAIQEIKKKIDFI